MIQMLVDKGADVHVRMSNGDSVLHVAIHHYTRSRNLLEIVKILVDSGCDPAVCNSDGRTPLHIAAIKGNVSLVKYLL
ncbi:hypothetical protein PAXINDRAFT_44599, partial [Paxillus involutus ATCC 200175]